MVKQTLPSVDELTRLIEDAKSCGLHPSVIRRLSVLRYFMQYRPTVLELCRHFCISRSTFHRWVERFDPADPLSLDDRSHDDHRERPPTVSAEAIELIRRYRHEAPLLGKERIAFLLRQQHGVTVSASTVGRVIDRMGLYFGETPLHAKKRIDQGFNGWTVPDRSPMAASGAAAGGGVPSFVRSPDPETMSPAQIPPPVVHVHVPETPESRSSFTGFIKFIVLTSLLINVVFISMLLGMALFERSTLISAPRMDATNIPAAGQSEDGLHAASPGVLFPE
jgi:transposase